MKLRTWVKAHAPKWEYFLFDVPWNGITVFWLVVLILLLVGIVLLPVDTVAKWMGR